MAVIHSPPPGLPTPSSSTGRRHTAPAAPKLRDSCQVCASSKLKCYKEKPSCSRCAKRGLICEYVATKRGGRKHDDQSGNNGSGNTSPQSTATNPFNGTQPLPPLNSWFAPSSNISTTDLMPSPGVVQPSRASTSGASSDPFPSLLSPVDQSLSSALTDSITDLNNPFPSPTSFSVPDLPDSDVLGQPQFFSTEFDSSSNESNNLFDDFPAFDDAISDLLALSTPHSPPNSRAPTSISSNAQSYQGPSVADAPCFCLVQALGLMKQLFPNPSTPCTTSATQSLDKDTAVPTIQAVMAKNEHTIEAVSAMLQCPCSQDGYLLTIMSLIVFKILSWYAAAARQTPSSDDDNQSVQSSPTFHSHPSSLSEPMVQDTVVFGSSGLEGEDSARMARQLVLSELHRVQRLLNHLSAKLKLQSAKSGADTPNSLGGGNSGSETNLPLSGMMLDQLGVDLRKQLRTLSLDIVEGLRGE